MARWIAVGDHVIETEHHVADIQWIETFGEDDLPSGGFALIRTDANAFQWIEQEVRPLEIQVNCQNREEFESLVTYITGARYVSSWDKHIKELRDGKRQ